MAIDELEAALRTSWSFDDLAVYGDHLLRHGDPRGEVISLDLRPLPDDPAWQDRRAAALRSWLGKDLAKRYGHLVQHGFIHELRTGTHPIELLDTILGAAVRGCSISGDHDHVEAALVQLARFPRPWLTRLSIALRRGNPVEDELVPRIVEATPHLRELRLVGRPTFRAFPHPALRQLLSVRGNTPIVGDGVERRELYALEDAPGAMVLVDELALLLEAIASTPELRALHASYGDLFEGGEPLFALLARLQAAGLVEVEGVFVRLARCAREFMRGTTPRHPPVVRPAEGRDDYKWVLWSHAGASGSGAHRGVTDVGLLRGHGALVIECLERLPLDEHTQQVLVDYLAFLAGLPAAGEWEPVDFEDPDPLRIALRRLIELHGLSSFHDIGDSTSWSWLTNLLLYLEGVALGRRISFRVAWGF